MVVSMSNVGAADEIEFVDDDVASPDLYKGSFSLAYGTCNLLRETKLHLKKVDKLRQEYPRAGHLGGEGGGLSQARGASPRSDVSFQRGSQV